MYAAKIVNGIQADTARWASVLSVYVGSLQLAMRAAQRTGPQVRIVAERAGSGTREPIDRAFRRTVQHAGGPYSSMTFDSSLAVNSRCTPQRIRFCQDSNQSESDRRSAVARVFRVSWTNGLSTGGTARAASVPPCRHGPRPRLAAGLSKKISFFGKNSPFKNQRSRSAKRGRWCMRLLRQRRDGLSRTARPCEKTTVRTT